MALVPSRPCRKQVWSRSSMTTEAEPRRCWFPRLRDLKRTMGTAHSAAGSSVDLSRGTDDPFRPPPAPFRSFVVRPAWTVPLVALELASPGSGGGTVPSGRTYACAAVLGSGPASGLRHGPPPDPLVDRARRRHGAVRPSRGRRGSGSGRRALANGGRRMLRGTYPPPHARLGSVLAHLGGQPAAVSPRQSAKSA